MLFGITALAQDEMPLTGVSLELGWRDSGHSIESPHLAAADSSGLLAHAP